MKIPDIEMEKLKKFKENNFQDRLEFIRKYADWVKKNTNKNWSSEQEKIVD